MRRWPLLMARPRRTPRCAVRPPTCAECWRGCSSGSTPATRARTRSAAPPERRASAHLLAPELHPRLGVRRLRLDEPQLTTTGVEGVDEQVEDTGRRPRE